MKSKTSVQPNSTERNPLPMSRPATDYTSTPCRLVLEGPMLGTDMDETTREVRAWVLHEFGEDAVDLSMWAEEDDIVQALIRLSDKVVVSDLSWHAGKIIEETETHLTLEGEDEESYLKIFTPFRGVAKLVLFENDRWVDAETHSSIANFDFSSLGLDTMPDLSLDGEKDTKDKKTKSKKK